MVMFIDDHREVYGVEPICRVLPIAPSTYYEQKARQVDPGQLPVRVRRDDELLVGKRTPRSTGRARPGCSSTARVSL